jgi:hypothetical protein
MPKRRIEPTDALRQTIAAYIRAGAFPHVAATAAGVPSELFDRWLSLAARKRPSAKLRTFAEAINMAQAQARVSAEMELLKEDPRTWLTRGPGKEQPNKPGWSGVVKPIVAIDQRHTINLLADPSTAALLQLFLAAIAPFPEARKAAIDALNQSSPQHPIRAIEVDPEPPTPAP